MANKMRSKIDANVYKDYMAQPTNLVVNGCRLRR